MAIFLVLADQPVKSLHSPAYQLLVETIIEEREGARVGQEELSKCLGQARMYMYKCETLRRRVDPVEVVEISKALGLGKDGLMTRWLAKLTK